jgi:hypothetical protein
VDGDSAGRISQKTAWEVSWQWRDREGTWISYTEEDSARIDTAMDRCESTCTIIVDDVPFTLDLQRMIQRRSDVDVDESKSGGTSRPEYAVRRWDPQWNEHRGLAWNKRIRELCPTWESQTSSVQVCPVDAGTSDYEKVARLLFDCEGSLTKRTHEICRVVRVQNLETFIPYVNERESIIRKRGGGSRLFLGDSIAFLLLVTYLCRAAKRGLPRSWHKKYKPVGNGEKQPGL